MMSDNSADVTRYMTIATGAHIHVYIAVRRKAESLNTAWELLGLRHINRFVTVLEC